MIIYAEFSAISNSDIREMFDLEEKDKVKASRIIKDTIAAGLEGFISTVHQAYCYDFVSDWLHSELVIGTG